MIVAEDWSRDLLQYTFQLAFSDNPVIFCHRGKEIVSFCSSEKHCSANSSMTGSMFLLQDLCIHLFLKTQAPKHHHALLILALFLHQQPPTASWFILNLTITSLGPPPNKNVSFYYLWSFLLCLLWALLRNFPVPVMHQIRDLRSSQSACHNTKFQ